MNNKKVLCGRCGWASDTEKDLAIHMKTHKRTDLAEAATSETTPTTDRGRKTKGGKAAENSMNQSRSSSGTRSNMPVPRTGGSQRATETATRDVAVVDILTRDTLITMEGDVKDLLLKWSEWREETDKLQDNQDALIDIVNELIPNLKKMADKIEDTNSRIQGVEKVVMETGELVLKVDTEAAQFRTESKEIEYRVQMPKEMLSKDQGYKLLANQEALNKGLKKYLGELVQGLYTDIDRRLDALQEKAEKIEELQENMTARCEKDSKAITTTKRHSWRALEILRAARGSPAGLPVGGGTRGRAEGKDPPNRTGTPMSTRARAQPRSTATTAAQAAPTERTALEDSEADESLDEEESEHDSVIENTTGRTYRGDDLGATEGETSDRSRNVARLPGRGVIGTPQGDVVSPAHGAIMPETRDNKGRNQLTWPDSPEIVAAKKRVERKLKEELRAVIADDEDDWLRASDESDAEAAVEVEEEPAETPGTRGDSKRKSPPADNRRDVDKKNRIGDEEVNKD